MSIKILFHQPENHEVRVDFSKDHQLSLSIEKSSEPELLRNAALPALIKKSLNSPSPFSGLQNPDHKDFEVVIIASKRTSWNKNAGRRTPHSYSLSQHERLRRKLAYLTLPLRIFSDIH